MKRDELYLETASRTGFRFDEQVAEVFDDMLVRSIPLYVEQQAMIAELAASFWVPGTNVYDLGCSTATTLIALAGKLEGPGRLVGYDSSDPMLARASRAVAERGLAERIELRSGDLNGDLRTLPLDAASVVTMCWTLQFVGPDRRESLVRWIYEALGEGGALILSEKIVAGSPRADRLFTDWYHAFKTRNGYSETEIARKREALENVLVPYRIEENAAILRRAGFEIVETFFQWYNFAGFLCVKSPA